LLDQFSLTHKAKETAHTCSGGERRRLEIARALMTRPKLMLLDEPFAAVDPHTVEELQEEVRKLAKDGIAILVTDHNVQQTLRICDRAYIIHEGKQPARGHAAGDHQRPAGARGVPGLHVPGRRVRLIADAIRTANPLNSHHSNRLMSPAV
jgi:ABC-type lipopolysaccharide export system ATPase subunit